MLNSENVKPRVPERVFQLNNLDLPQGRFRRRFHGQQHRLGRAWGWQQAAPRKPERGGSGLSLPASQEVWKFPTPCRRGVRMEGGTKNAGTERDTTPAIGRRTFSRSPKRDGNAVWGRFCSGGGGVWRGGASLTARPAVAGEQRTVPPNTQRPEVRPRLPGKAPSLGFRRLHISVVPQARRTPTKPQDPGLTAHVPRQGQQNE